MSDIENRMVIDRAWPKPQAATTEMVIDSISCDAMYHDFDWVDELSAEDMKEIVCEVTYAAWRGQYKSDRDRLDSIRAALLSFIEPWAEGRASDE